MYEESTAALISELGRLITEATGPVGNALAGAKAWICNAAKQSAQHFDGG